MTGSPPLKVMHYPGKIEQISWDGKEVLLGLPLCGEIDLPPVAEQSGGIVICEECRLIALAKRLSDKMTD